MESILAIDPGQEQSGWLRMENSLPVSSGIVGNEPLVMNLIPCIAQTAGTVLVVEMVGHYGTGMSVGRSIFDTCVWIGRFIQAWPGRHVLMLQPEVRMFLCGTMRAKLPNIRQALLDRFPATGGGATPQVGTKKQPGPLYGIKTHIWSALALAVTYEGRNEKGMDDD